ncbi:hypothetical protein ACFX2I_024890 [Malus domestica]
MSEADARWLNSLIFVCHALKLLLACNKTLLVSSFITFHHIASPGWWHEDEFLLYLVGGMNGKLPNDIRVRVVHFITWLVA